MAVMEFLREKNPQPFHTKPTCKLLLPELTSTIKRDIFSFFFFSHHPVLSSKSTENHKENQKSFLKKKLSEMVIITKASRVATGPHAITINLAPLA